MTLRHPIKIILSIAMSIALVACANNAPAPVFDATLAQNVRFELNNESVKPAHAIIAATQNNRSAANYSNAISPPPSAFNVKKNNTLKPSKLGTSKLSIDKKIQHTVKPGETLYSIAWQYSIDHKALSNINNIRGSSIYPGQVLLLTKDTQSTSNQLGVFSKKSLVAALNKEILSADAKTRLANAAKNKKLVTKPITSPITRSSKKAAAQSVKSWIWPVNGKVIQHFSNRSNSSKGVDIAAKRGAPVRASANGKVVYSGSGLRGYGQLVIIKHNDVFLSAYAHNDKVHVKENEFVKAGQKIADLGRSGSDKDKLHFEIRYKGKPVDPLNYLPKN